MKRFYKLLVSDIAFLAGTPNKIVRQVPSGGWMDGSRKSPELSCNAIGNPALVYRYEHTGNTQCVVELPPIAALETSAAMSWEMWSYLIDLKMFGRETPFSNIPQPLDL